MNIEDRRQSIHAASVGYPDATCQGVLSEGSAPQAVGFANTGNAMKIGERIL